MLGSVCPYKHIVKHFLCPFEHFYGDIIYVDKSKGIKAMHERVKKLVGLNQTTIEDALKGTGITLNTYNTLIRNSRYPRADSLNALSLNLKTTSEYLLRGDEGFEYILAWAERNGVKWKPPPRMGPLIDAAEKLSDTELKKLIEIAKICKTEELESSPQSKIG